MDKHHANIGVDGSSGDSEAQNGDFPETFVRTDSGELPGKAEIQKLLFGHPGGGYVLKQKSGEVESSTGRGSPRRNSEHYSAEGGESSE